MSEITFTVERFNMYGHELDEKYKIKENGKIFWGSHIIIKNENGTFDYSRIDPQQTQSKPFDTDRKAINFAKKLLPNMTSRDRIRIYSRQRYDNYMSEYERIKSEELTRK